MIREVARPFGRCAVVVVDSQNDYCHPDGALYPADPASSVHASIKGQRRVLEAAGDHPVFFVRDVCRTDHLTSSPTRLYERYRIQQTSSYETLEWGYEGTWGSEVLQELRDAALHGIDVFKNRASAFVSTNLDLLLRSNLIDAVFVIGVATDVCVNATVRDCADHGYRTIVVSDAVGAFREHLHAAALRIFEAKYEVMTSSETSSILGKAGS